jgi:serine/threonine protein phosphatase PrpC
MYFVLLILNLIFSVVLHEIQSGANDVLLAGVFDGHGGDAASKSISQCKLQQNRQIHCTCVVSVVALLTF